MSSVRPRLKSVSACAAIVCRAGAQTAAYRCAWHRQLTPAPFVLNRCKQSLKPLHLAARSTTSSACQQLQTTSPDMTIPAADLHVQQAWEFWRRIGSPKFHVAPMVDQVYISFHSSFSMH